MRSAPFHRDRNGGCAPSANGCEDGRRTGQKPGRRETTVERRKSGRSSSRRRGPGTIIFSPFIDHSSSSSAPGWTGSPARLRPQTSRALCTRAFKYVTLLILFTCSLFASSDFSLEQIADDFPSTGLEGRIAFWKNIFTKYGDREVLFHDADDMRLIYEVMKFRKGITDDQAEAKRQAKLLKREQHSIERMLKHLSAHHRHPSKLRPEEKKILRTLNDLGYRPSASLFRHLRQNVHFQRGIKETFQEGLVRSGLYLDRIEEVIKRHRLPQELALLPHVESSFRYDAYSKWGAAGIWQFMRGTGRRFLTINRYIDERRDPLKATEAAAKFLEENYQELGTWPLAITAFNHGKYGMLRAKKRYGSDLVKIIDHYRSRSFGFASKNFYAEFLAAVDVVRNSDRYFPELQMAKPLQFDVIPLARAYRVAEFVKVRGISEQTLKDYNPQVTNYVWHRAHILPLGLKLRVPSGIGTKVAQHLQRAKPVRSPIILGHDSSIEYRIRSGDTLIQIAQRFGTSARRLQAINSIRNPRRIYPGQVLVIAGSGNRPKRYRVHRGDTLSTIAAKFGISVSRLSDLNEIRDPNQIFLGQSLLIP